MPYSLLSSSSWGLLVVLSATAHISWMVAGGQPKWTVLYAAFAVIVACSWRERYRLDTLGWIILAFILWAGMSLLWSSDWRAGAVQMQKLIVLAGIFFAWRAWGKYLAEFVTLAMAGVLILAVSVDFRLAAGFGNENFATEWILLALPLVGYVLLGGQRFEHLTSYKHITISLCSALVFVLGIAYLITNDSKLEFVALYSFGFCYFVWKRWWTVSAIWLLFPLNIVLLWPELVPDGLLGSLGSRVVFSFNTIAMWLDSPVFGWGFGSYNYEYPRYMLEHQSWLSFGPRMALSNYIGAAHNEPLQLLAELGVVGLALASLTILAALRESRYPLATLWILAGLMLTGFPLQNPATAFLAVLCLAELSKSSRRSEQRSLLERWCTALWRRCGATFYSATRYGR